MHIIVHIIILCYAFIIKKKKERNRGSCKILNLLKKSFNKIINYSKAQMFLNLYNKISQLCIRYKKKKEIVDLVKF